MLNHRELYIKTIQTEFQESKETATGVEFSQFPIGAQNVVEQTTYPLIKNLLEIYLVKGGGLLKKKRSKLTYSAILPREVILMKSLV